MLITDIGSAGDPEAEDYGIPSLRRVIERANPNGRASEALAEPFVCRKEGLQVVCEPPQEPGACSSRSTPAPTRGSVAYVYVNGVFDMCHFGHQRLFMLIGQIKRRDPSLRVLVGVHADNTCIGYKRLPFQDTGRRALQVLLNDSVDAVLVNAPLEGITAEFMEQHRIRYVGMGEEYLRQKAAPFADIPGTVVGDKWYGLPREQGRAVAVPRCEHLSTTGLVEDMRRRGGGGQPRAEGTSPGRPGDGAGAPTSKGPAGANTIVHKIDDQFADLVGDERDSLGLEDLQRLLAERKGDRYGEVQRFQSEFISRADLWESDGSLADLLRAVEACREAAVYTKKGCVYERLPVDGAREFVYVPGVFDMAHFGHQQLLRVLQSSVREGGRKLLVGIHEGKDAFMSAPQRAVQLLNGGGADAILVNARECDDGGAAELYPNLTLHRFGPGVVEGLLEKIQEQLGVSSEKMRDAVINTPE